MDLTVSGQALKVRTAGRITEDWHDYPPTSFLHSLAGSPAAAVHLMQPPASTPDSCRAFYLPRLGHLRGLSLSIELLHVELLHPEFRFVLKKLLSRQAVARFPRV